MSSYFTDLSSTSVLCEIVYTSRRSIEVDSTEIPRHYFPYNDHFLASSLLQFNFYVNRILLVYFLPIFFFFARVLYQNITLGLSIVITISGKLLTKIFNINLQIFAKHWRWFDKVGERGHFMNTLCCPFLIKFNSMWHTINTPRLVCRILIRGTQGDVVDVMQRNSLRYNMDSCYPFKID